MGKEIEVKTIWSEMVKPFNPTHSNTTFKYSFVDQIAPFFHYSNVLFYNASSIDRDQLMTNLKASLSKTLSKFYPLAGRLIDDFTIVCNDEGVLLTHAQVTCTLKTYLTQITTSPELLGKLLPCKKSLHRSHLLEPIPNSAWLQLAFQVNFFQCGGVVIGCTMNHKTIDGSSLSTFLGHWAGLCTGLGPENVVQPDFDIAVTTFPPSDPGHLPSATLKSKDFLNSVLKDHLVMASNYTGVVTCKVFLFKAAAISALKEITSTERTPNPTKVQSVLGFIWKKCVEADADAEAGPTCLILTLNLRPTGDPPLPRESMGNIMTNAVARAEKNGLGSADLVSEIREAIHKKAAREFQGKNGRDALSEQAYMIVKEVFKPSSYKVSCQCRLGFTDIDFGFGKPAWVCPFDGSISPLRRKDITMMDHGDGIMVWIILEKEHMHKLETNPDFLAFASPLEDLSSII